MDDDDTLNGLQRAAFEYFLTHTHPRNGLVADTSRAGAPASIAVVGFALSVQPIGVERGWTARADAARRCLSALRFFDACDQTDAADASGHHGFFFHFLDIDSGARVWESELSMIDSALLIAGVLTAAAYFDADNAVERELRALADAIYRRVDWRWAQRDGGAVAHGWKPDSGFLNYGWEGYSEALLLYVLGLGSPTHALSDESFHAWTLTYQWENLYGHEHLYAGPLFIHQFSHAWIDFRGIRDRFMREKNCDYFENSRRACFVQREYAIRNPRGFAGYGEDCWGLSAGDGPHALPRRFAGRYQAFYGYAARGVPYGPDDGTICASAALCALVFAPDIVWPMVRRLAAAAGPPDYRLLRAGGFNPTLRECEGSPPWVTPDVGGLEQGMIVLMIENVRSGLPWKLGRVNPYIAAGLRRAGFSGGWL
ncbi:MAG: glucoamylase family protein [Burkholderiales bacterium]